MYNNVYLIYLLYTICVKNNCLDYFFKWFKKDEKYNYFAIYTIYLYHQ